MKPFVRLTEDDIAAVIDIIDGWRADNDKPLTWPNLVSEVADRLGRPYTRQGLALHKRIQDEFTERRKDIMLEKGKPHRKLPVALQKAADRIKRLETEVRRLQFENDNLMHRWIKGAYNWHTNNDKDAPLPRITSIAQRKTK